MPTFKLGCHNFCLIDLDIVVIATLKNPLIPILTHDIFTD